MIPRIDIERPESVFFGRKLLEGETEQGMELQVGSILEGKVTTITKFGAFVALEGGKSGLVHISEIANTFVNDVREFLQEGQEVKVMVLSAENGKINLSIKKAQPPQERTAAPRPAARPGNGSAPRANNGSAAPRQGYQPRPVNRAPQSAAAAAPVSAEQSFEDKLKQFLSSSEGKMADLNRSIDGKRGGGRRRR